MEEEEGGSKDGGYLAVEGCAAPVGEEGPLGGRRTAQRRMDTQGA